MIYEFVGRLLFITNRFLFKVFHSSFHEIVLTQQICREQVFHEFALKLWMKEWKPLLPIRFMNIFTATLVERYGFFNPIKFWHFVFTIHIFLTNGSQFSCFFVPFLFYFLSFVFSVCVPRKTSLSSNFSSLICCK